MKGIFDTHELKMTKKMNHLMNHLIRLITSDPVFNFSNRYDTTLVEVKVFHYYLFDYLRRIRPFR